MLAQQQYGEAAKLLSVVTMLSGEFKQYTPTPKLTEILQEIELVRNQAYFRAEEEFKSYIASYYLID